MDLQFIALELKRLGMSQVEIARAVDCSQPTISEIQSGRIGKSRPSYRLVSSLKDLYEVKLAESRKEAE
ncbi:helix-turn-helix domain-containing protein [Burkholderia cenocepacia]|uniref:helix-turn-helix domain-containing protein n=1 Tax=Burkholderia cepacia complex TaxID=87882 RepID=UPI0026549472|nr:MULTISPECIES: helix-turn-helix transcriptional regulator [Burkholderia cepacia complex]MDN7895851.1 helix-turn-helix transcriptional regulator [Burkholderia cepacia]MDR8027006.1 helix-turn-helix domain-containing protein [Burkholderia cenocepacia]MDR8044258.1 helix-turn-helix domain-containing protein [Burkholderia cenocepacia]